MGAGAEVAAWSFHPRKVLTTGEGGMLTTTNAEWAARARRLREHGMSVSAAARHASVLAPAEEYLEVGFNYRMTDLQAAVGLVQLDRLPEVVASAPRARRGLRQGDRGRPRAACGHGPGVRHQQLPVLLGRGRGRTTRWTETDCSAQLAAADISARRGIMATHRQPAYATATTGSPPLPVTERLTDTTLILPLFHQLSDSEQARVRRRPGTAREPAMRSLVLVAASGLAREVLALERRHGRYGDLVVVDDDPRLWGTTLDGVPVIGGLDAAADLDEADLVVCAGSGATRRDLVRRLAGLGVPPTRFGRVVHPSVELPSGCTIGRGSILLASVVLTADVTLGRHVVVMPHATLTHDDVVDDYATLCAGVSLGGSVRVGEASYLGMNSCVREHVTVGPEATLGMGAALIEPLPSGQTWVGVPARRVVAAMARGA